MKTICEKCGSKIDVDIPTDETLLNRISALEGKIQPNKEEELATHLKSCPNCQEAVREIVSKKWDLEDDEREEEDEDEEEEL